MWYLELAYRQFRAVEYGGYSVSTERNFEPRILPGSMSSSALGRT